MDAEAQTKTNGALPPSKLPNRRKSASRCRLTKTALLVIVIVLTSWFFLVEIVVGYLTKSNALVADSFHMLSDIISLIIGLTALRFSKKESSKKNTFGWARAEVLGSLVNAVFLLALCFTIVVDSISRFLKPEPLEKIDLMLGVGAGGLALNLISLLLFAVQACQERGGESGSKEMNMNLQGVFLNALGDSLGSVAVIVSGVLIKFAPPENDTHAQWKLYIDPVLSLIIAGIIVSSTIPLLKKSSLILLQGVPLSCNVEELRQKIFDVKGVVDVHHFHVWSLNSEKMIASAHGKKTFFFHFYQREKKCSKLSYMQISFCLFNTFLSSCLTRHYAN
jgi:zinc transporter 1